MKKWMLTICCALLLVVVGCDEEKITAGQVQELAAQVQQLSTTVDGYQAATSGVLESLQVYEIIDETIAEKVEKVSSEIDRVQPQVANIVTAIMAADLDEDEVTNWIRLLQAGTQASAPWNPYAAPVLLGLALLEGVYALIKRKQANDNKREAEANRLKYQAHKQGTELTAKQMSEVEGLSSTLYENIGNARADLGAK